MIEPCIVCAYPVQIEDTRRESYVDKIGMQAEPDGRMTTLVVCGASRCQRLIKEAIAEHGQHQYEGEL